MTEQLSCTCQEWQENYSHIERAIRLARAYNYDVPSVLFRYCPFCGRPLVDKQALAVQKLYHRERGGVRK